MVTPALPAIAEELGVSDGEIGRASSLFFLASAVSGLFLSRWSDFIGRKPTFMIVMTFLVIGTFLSATATSLPVLLIGRVLQGFSGAAFQLAYVTLNQILTPKAFASALGVITAVNGGVGGLDGWWGGILVENFGYQSIFWIILVVALIAWLGIILVVPNQKPTDTEGSMDWLGATLLGLALIAITLFIEWGPASGWTTPSTMLLFAGFVVFVVLFVLAEKRVETPMFPIEALTSRQVWPVVLTTFLALTSVFAVINFVLVMYSQNFTVGFGMEADEASLRFLTPPAMIGLISAPAAGWLAGKFGWKEVAMSGLVLSIGAIAVIWMFLDQEWIVFAMVIVLGVSYNGLILTTINGMGVVQSPKSAPGALPGLNSAAFGVGASMGITLVSPIVARGGFGDFKTALLVLAGIAVLALLSASMIRPAYTKGEAGDGAAAAPGEIESGTEKQ